MDSRERVSAATLPHLSRGGGVGSVTAGGGAGAGVMYRNVQSNGNVSRGSTLERPVARSVVHPQTAPAGHLVTTTADVEHHHPRPDLRSPMPGDSSPFPVFDTNQMLTKKIVIRRHDNYGFGFTLRHFIVYPPEPGSQGPERFPQAIRVSEPMDTVFVKEVRPNGPAHVAGLKTGDRLRTVNGLPVDGMQYAHVVSIIQQVPQILTLQIIPKEFDFLQTQFGETAHNPETNQRPRPCPPQVAANSGFQQQQQQQQVAAAPHHPSAFVAHPSVVSPYHSNNNLQPLQHHLTLQSPNVVAAAAAAGVQLHSPGKRRESLASLSSHDSNMKEIEESNAAIAMLRLKKNIEQKEEFMRRPQQMASYPPQGQQQQPTMPSRRSVEATSNGQVMPREFYSRPKKLQRPVWPPTMDEQQQQAQLRQMEQQHQFVPIHSPTAQQMQQSKLLKSKCREQFFNMLQQNEGGSGSGDDSVKDAKSDDYPIPANGLHIVSEKTKLFESGRPLSPDGSSVDRTLLYKSELSRLNQKVATPNVALRKKEYEQIHEHSDYSRLSTDTETIASDTASVTRQLQSPPLLLLPPPTQTHQHQLLSVPGGDSQQPPVVVVLREPKQGSAAGDGVSEDDRRMRRISYLRATANDNHLEINNNSLTLGNSGEYAENDRAMAMNVISDNRDKRRHGRQLADGEVVAAAPQPQGDEAIIKDNHQHHGQYNDEDMAVLLRGSNANGTNEKQRRVSTASSILALHEGAMQIKFTLIEGKRSHDRSWKNVWAELKGSHLNLTVLRDGKPNQSLGRIDLHNFQVMDATDYTKRKHVFKLLSRPPVHHSTTAQIGQTEILVQAENDSQMGVWRDLLQAVCDPNSLLKKDCVVQDTQHQVAEPQSVASRKVLETPSPNLSDDLKTSGGGGQGRKYYLGSRSPSGQSPVTKSRKTPQQLNISVGGSSFGGDKSKDSGSSDKEAGSPKPRAWKLLVTKQLRKIQGSGAAPVSFPEAASIGVPLQFCVPSEDDEYVPLLVARCTGIVEEKGLDIIGVYRIPGNTANITALTELVNRGFDETTLADHRWDDVNVVSSLLKAFLRQLPEPLIPDEMYPSFISADKKRGAVRLMELKEHLDHLPVHNYHTMRHLMRHLYRVSENCAINLMDPKNIAIVFGPSVIRMSKQTLELAVKDMKHQCCIVEVLVSQYQYFFENGPMPVISEVSSPTADSVSSVPNTNLLLDNVAKLEPMGERNSSSSIVGSIVQAANRKLRKNRKTILSSGGTPDNLSLDSSTSTESKDVAAIYSTIERKEGSSGGSGSGGDRLKGHSLAHDEDQPDSLLHENGSMSLNTVTLVLDNKLRTLRSSMDENTTDGDDDDDDDDAKRKHPVTAKRKSLGENGGQEKHQSLFKSNKWKVKHFAKNQPLTVFDDNIPYADESPERSMTVIPGPTTITTNATAPATAVAVTTTTTTTTTTINNNPSRLPIRQNSFKNAVSGADDLHKEQQSNNSDQGVDGLSSTSSDETDTSTTSSVQMTVDPEMLRKMNRILTNLERNTTKMNRSLSLNYKNVQKGGDCCCHVNHRLMNRVSTAATMMLAAGVGNNGGSGGGGGVGVVTSGGLTKDEKTDKNNMKKRHSQEGALNGTGRAAGVSSGGGGGGGVVARRYGNRSIRRRHTVGGTHDYSPRGGTGGENYRTPCHNYVMHRSSSPE